MNIAQEIFEQFGGNRAMAMIDGVALTSKDRLTIKFKGCRATNCVEIILAPDDTYTMKFYKICGLDAIDAGIKTGIYAEYLADVFENVTALRLSF